MSSIARIPASFRNVRWGLCLVASLFFFHGVVYADYTQQNIYQLGINYYDVNDDSCSTDSSSSDDSPSVSSGSTQTTAQQIASTFILGFDASTPKNIITDLATKYHIGGMYLTGTKDAAGAGFDKTFYDSLEKASGSSMVIASDEEGVVTRYDYGGTSFPSAAAMAKKSDADVTAIGTAAGKVMASNGLTTDLAPVLDLRDVGNGLTGRSFSSNPDVVADKAGAFTAGLKASGITPVFKHFPGFDSTTSGSTDNQKVVMNGSIDKTVQPYKTLLAKYPDAAVMLSNLYVTALDSDNPSSMSAKTVDYLRNQLKFSGPITTDDLSVQSVTNKAGGLGSAVATALQAGVDMPLFQLTGSSVADAESNLNKVIAAVQQNTAAVSSVTKNTATVAKLKGSGTTNTDSNTNTGACCGGSATVLSGTDNKTKIWNYFVSKGLSGVGTAGIMGNMSAESSFNPAAHQTAGAWDDMGTDYGQAVGLVQWDGGRRPAFIKYAEAHGATLDELKQGSDKTLGIELDYVWQELNGPYQSTLAALKAATNAGDAAYQFHKLYEGSNDTQSAIQSNRIDPAIKIYNDYSGMSSGTSIDTSSDSGCVGQTVDCSSATGVAVILCKAKAYDTASYEYAAGPRSGAAWHKQCPTIGPSCKIDCSLLVTLAVYDAFGVTLPGTDTAGERSDVGKYWQKIPFSQVQPGDIVQPDPGHVEVVDHVIGKKLYDFAAQTDGIPQPEQVGPQQETDNSGNLYLHYIGPTT